LTFNYLEIQGKGVSALWTPLYVNRNSRSKSLSNAIKNHVDDEDKGVTEIVTPGGNQKMTIILPLQSVSSL